MNVLWSSHTNVVGCCLPCMKYLYSTPLASPGHSWSAVWLILCTTCQPVLQFVYNAIWVGGDEWGRRGGFETIGCNQQQTLNFSLTEGVRRQHHFSCLQNKDVSKMVQNFAPKRNQTERISTWLFKFEADGLLQPTEKSSTICLFLFCVIYVPQGLDIR